MKNLNMIKTSLIFSASFLMVPALWAQTETEKKPEIKAESPAEVKVETKSNLKAKYVTVSAGFEVSKGEKDSAKFQEYSDTKTGILLDGNGMYFYDDGYHAYFDIKNAGRKDQSYKLGGGVYNSFKYGLWYDSIYHKLSKNNSTIFSGVGTQDLTYAGTAAAVTSSTYVPMWSSNLDDWSSFEYSTTKTDFGVSYEYTPLSPFYAGITITKGSRTGNVVRSGPAGENFSATGTGNTGASGNPTEFPAAVKDQTLDVDLSAGYRTDDFFILADANSNAFTSPSFIGWRSPSVSNSEIVNYTTLAPNSTMTAMSLQGTVYKLPMESTLTVRASSTDTKSKFDLLQTMVSSATSGAPTYAVDTLNVNSPEFSGYVKRTSFSTVWRGEVADTSFDLYFRDNQRKDNSEEIIYYSEAANPTSNSGLLYSNRSQNMGLELDRKVAARTKVKLGHDYLKVARSNQDDAINGIDHKTFLSVKNTDWDLLNVNIGFDHFVRSTQFEKWLPGTPNSTQNYIRYFDVSSKKGDSIKLEFDSSPADNLEVSLGGKQTKDTYPGTYLGLTDDSKYEVFFDASYNIPEVVKIMIFGDTERSYRNARHYKGANNPENGPVTATAYTWEDRWTDKTNWVGIKLEVPLIEDKLSSQFGVTKEDSVAGINFVYPQGGGPTTRLVDITNMGNYQKLTYTAQFDAKIQKNLRASLVALFETLKADDIQYNDYKKVDTKTNAYNLFSGSGADNNYKNAYAIQTKVAYDF